MDIVSVSFMVYTAVIALVSLGAYFFTKSRSKRVGNGLILSVLGVYWLYLGKVPGRMMPDITGLEGLAAGSFTVVCGLLLMLLRPGSASRK